MLDLIKRTKVEVLDEFTKQAPGVRNCRVTATAADGSSHVGHLKWTTEDIERGLSDAEIEDKFNALNRDIMPAGERRALLDALWRLDDAAECPHHRRPAARLGRRWPSSIPPRDARRAFDVIKARRRRDPAERRRLLADRRAHSRR